ncbi:class I SAM-dependent methyltransferase [Myxococcota bacterium]|jgi:predicted methyltransferase|nr:class I SAM-dependent methyltransferase [Myxococcota bacterium]
MMTRIATRAALFSAVAVSACGAAPHDHEHGAGHGHHGHHAFKDPAEWAKRFDDPARDEWQKPDAVIGHLRLSSNSKVADVGAGTGYFVVRLAPQVPVGKVYAVDIEASMVEHTVERARGMGFSNVAGVVAPPTEAALPEPVDVVLLVNTYHHIEARPAYFGKLRGSLLPGGRVVLVDYKKDPDVPGAPMEMRLTPEEVIEEMSAAGYRLATRSEGALPRQYILIFESN